MKNKKRFIKGFTLVELIVVIAIVAILAVSAGMILTKWIGKSQDVRKITDINTIKKTLLIDYTTLGKYPKPYKYKTISSNDGNTLWYQGYFGETTVEKLDSISKVPLDPAGSGYMYSVTENGDLFEVYATIENKDVASYKNNSYANLYNGYIISAGNYNGEGSSFINSSKTFTKVPSIYMFSGDTLYITGSKKNYLYAPGKSVSNTDGIFILGYNTKKMPDGNVWTTETMKHTTNFAIDNQNTWLLEDCSDLGSDCNATDNEINYSTGKQRLYSWYAAIGNDSPNLDANGNLLGLNEHSVCGKLGAGWHLPSDQEFKDLEKSLGCSNYNIIGYDSARCSGTGWAGDLNGGGWAGSRLGGIVGNLPGYYDGSFSDFGNGLNIWTSTLSGSIDDGTPFARQFYNEEAITRTSNTWVGDGYSIICVKSQ